MGPTAKIRFFKQLFLMQRKSCEHNVRRMNDQADHHDYEDDDDGSMMQMMRCSVQVSRAGFPFFVRSSQAEVKDGERDIMLRQTH